MGMWRWVAHRLVVHVRGRLAEAILLRLWVAHALLAVLPQAAPVVARDAMRLPGVLPRLVDVLAEGLDAAGVRADEGFAQPRALLVQRLVRAQGGEGGLLASCLDARRHNLRLDGAVVPQARAVAVGVDLALAAVAVLVLGVLERLRDQEQQRSAGDA